MTIKNEMSYWIECDGCGERPEADYFLLLHSTPEKATADALEGDWYELPDGKHACGQCVTFDDEGEPILARMTHRLTPTESEKETKA